MYIEAKLRGYHEDMITSLRVSMERKQMDWYALMEPNICRLIIENTEALG